MAENTAQSTERDTSPTLSSGIPLAVSAIASALGSLATRFDVDVLDECDSTNSQLLQRAQAGAPSGTVLVAKRQTAGRGRLGRHWYSGDGVSLTFSLLWRPPAELALDGLSLTVGVAIADVLTALGISDIALKWPNDLLRQGRKLGGILIELVSGGSGSPRAVIIGIGLNLHLPDNLPDDVRLASAGLGLDIDRNSLLARLLQQLHLALGQFIHDGFGGFHARWQALNAFQGRQIRIQSAFTVLQEGRCQGVDDDGALLLQTAQGVQRIISGDVSLLPA